MSVPSRPGIPAAVLESGVVAIGRRLPPGRVVAIGEGLVAGGVGAFELTLNPPEADALRGIEAVAHRFGPDELLVGAGTVLSIEAAQRALSAGARFLVMPHTDPELVAWAAARGVPAFPGALTPTEIVAAWRAGAAAVKLFPASAVGPSFIRELRGPLPDVPIIPTGGIDLASAPAFIAAGAVAVGMGSWLSGDGDPAGVQDRATRLVAAIAAARGAQSGGVPGHP